MLNKFIPYGKQNITKVDIDLVIEALTSDYITQGPAVVKFEADLALYLNCKYVCVVSNGTAALHLASLALELQPGDAVIVPAISFVATSNSVLYCGATPIFADVDLKTGNISINSAEEAIQLAISKGLKPKAIYPVHFSGFPCDPSEIIAFAKKHNLKIVEDACHAIGAQYRKNSSEDFKMVGSHSDMAVWSFHPVKHITTGEGGAISTNNPELAAKLKTLRSHGITKDSSCFIDTELSFDNESNSTNLWYYEMQELGFNYRLPDILCSLGSAQLSRVNSFIEKRREIAEYYRENLKDLEHVTLPYNENENVIASYHLFPLQIDFSAIKKTKNQVMKELKSHNIGTQVHYIPIPWQPYYKNHQDKFLSTTIDNFRELSIPMYYTLELEECDFVISKLKEILLNKY